MEFRHPQVAGLIIRALCTIYRLWFYILIKKSYISITIDIKQITSDIKKGYNHY